MKRIVARKTDIELSRKPDLLFKSIKGKIAEGQILYPDVFGEYKKDK